MKMADLLIKTDTWSSTPSPSVHQRQEHNTAICSVRGSCDEARPRQGAQLMHCQSVTLQDYSKRVRNTEK